MRVKSRDAAEELNQRFRRPVGPAGGTLQRVANFIDQHRELVLASSAAAIGSHVGASDASVIRTVQGLGFQSMKELKQTLLLAMQKADTPAVNLKNTFGDLDQERCSAAKTVLSAHLESLAALQSEAFSNSVESAAAILNKATRIVLFGIGPSRAIATYVATQLTRTGRGVLMIGETGSGIADNLLAMRPGDAVVALAYGSKYPEINAVLAHARTLKTPVVMVTDGADNGLAKAGDATLVVPRGRADRVALHGATVVAMEALAITLAELDRAKSTKSLEKLAALRRLAAPGQTA